MYVLAKVQAQPNEGTLYNTMNVYRGCVDGKKAAWMGKPVYERWGERMLRWSLLVCADGERGVVGRRSRYEMMFLGLW